MIVQFNLFRIYLGIGPSVSAGRPELPDYGRESVPRVPQPPRGWFGPSGTGVLRYTDRDKSPGGRFHSMKPIVVGFFGVELVVKPYQCMTGFLVVIITGKQVYPR